MEGAQFILTGSSARKLIRRKEGVNLLPGRLIEMHLDALSLLELIKKPPSLEVLLADGLLPEVILTPDEDTKQLLLSSYVSLYLEQEIRAEALVRNVANFSQFLRLAAAEAGHPINATRLSQDLGISRNHINEYLQILVDCLIIMRIEPITKTSLRRKLTKSAKFLFFDLGVQRIASGEGKATSKQLGHLFEQFIGIETIKMIRLFNRLAKLKFWRDHAGPEVDFVIEHNKTYLPIEVKWTERPSSNDSKHIKKFMAEYPCTDIV